MALPYPDHVIRWSDGSTVPSELRGMLLTGLQPGFEIEHAEFAWDADKSLSMRLRLSITSGLRRPQTWEIDFSYPADEATAVRPEATAAEREWFTMMVRTHITEWWEGGPSVVTSARLVKLQLSSQFTIALAGSMTDLEINSFIAGGVPSSLSTRLSLQILALNSVEELGLFCRHAQLRIELLRARVIRIRRPLDAATIVLDGDIVETLHEQLAYTLAPSRLNYVELFKVQRPTKADCRPQERI